MANEAEDPASAPAGEASWLLTIFPRAAAREEQIRQAAREMKSHAEAAGAQREPGTVSAAQYSRAEPRSGGGASARGPMRASNLAFDLWGRAEKPAMPDSGSPSAGPFPAAALTESEATPAPSHERRDAGGQGPGGEEPAVLGREAAQDAPGVLDDETAHWWTLDVLAPLIHAAEGEDLEALAAILMMQFAFVASATPTSRAVENHKSMLLTLGPPVGAFRSAVVEATEMFLSERPRLDAAEVDRALQGGGPVEAAAALRALTDPEMADPLTAGRVYAGCEAVAWAIAGLLRMSPASDAAGIAGTSRADMSPERAASMCHNRLYQVFSDVSAASDSASRSDEGREAMAHLAAALRDAPIDLFVTASISAGDGVMLPLDIARQRLEAGDHRGADALAFLIEVGVEELRMKTHAAAMELEDSAALLAQQMAGGGAEGSGGGAGAWQDTLPAVAADLDALLAALDRYSYAFIRAARSLDEAGTWLDRLGNHRTLRALPRPQEEDFAAVSQALRTMPASVTEALRQHDADPADDHAYLRLRDAVHATRWFEDFRQFLQAIPGVDLPAR